MKTFMQKCLDREIEPTRAEITNHILEWMETDRSVEVSRYLGMRAGEFMMFVVNQEYLPMIVINRRNESPQATR